MTDENDGFGRVVGPFLKIGPDAVGQHCGLPDVEQIALLILEQIDARAGLADGRVWIGERRSSWSPVTRKNNRKALYLSSRLMSEGYATA